MFGKQDLEQAFRKRFGIIAFATSILCTGTAVSADTDEGARLAFKYHCATCHGQNGIARSDRYPNLAGQSVPYLVARLKYFRDGVERGNQMNGQAAPLSDDDIEKLAAYFNRPK
ncbi:MAG: cytochrome c [Gammaproteobacteria bacterium]|jgi:cytochrome c553|nr:MAG: cytochrome c [Gammaproteobacteria bacterium]